MPKQASDWPTKISCPADPNIRLGWELTYADGRVEVALGILDQDPWVRGLSTAAGQRLAEKIRSAGLEPWWVTRNLRWHAYQLGGKQPYRSREINPSDAKLLRDIRRTRAALEAARTAIADPPRGLFLDLRLEPVRSALLLGIGELNSEEARLRGNVRGTHGSFLRELQRRCDFTWSDLETLLRRFHPEELAMLRGTPRGGKKLGSPGATIQRWLRSVISRSR